MKNKSLPILKLETDQNSLREFVILNKQTRGFVFFFFCSLSESR